MRALQVDLDELVTAFQDATGEWNYYLDLESGQVVSISREAREELEGILGRTCPWKRCGPSIRSSCDALHCSRHPYLHDDLDTVCLDESLVAAPPIGLWPQVAARVPVPGDVERGLLLPLREGSGE